jgi:glycosyltransferase involved in cell wall biosynthesis
MASAVVVRSVDRIVKKISIVVPAYNEERYLGDTLTGIRGAASHLQSLRPSDSLEIIVVDNDSSDRTSELAVQQGCRIVEEKEHNIGKFRLSVTTTI